MPRDFSSINSKTPTLEYIAELNHLYFHLIQALISDAVIKYKIVCFALIFFKWS